MKAKLIDSSNKLMLNNYKEIEGNLSINGSAYWTYSLSTSFRTSSIISYKMINENIVELKTLNSTYTFMLIDCKFNSDGIKNVDPEIIKEHEILKNSLSNKWVCQLDGGFLDRAISVVTLEEDMTIDEAREYIMKNNIKDDNENMAIKTILKAWSQKNEI